VTERNCADAVIYGLTKTKLIEYSPPWGPTVPNATLIDLGHVFKDAGYNIQVEKFVHFE